MASSPGFAVQEVVTGLAGVVFVAFCADKAGCGWRDEYRDHDAAVEGGIAHLRKLHAQEGKTA
jgi:hypothetical protein